MHVSVIGGGQNSEHEISLGSAASVAAGLRKADFDVRELTIGRDGVWSEHGSPLGDTPASSLAKAVEATQGTVWFPVLHGPRGEDGTLAALCDLIGAPYVGSGLNAGALAMDKAATKRLAQERGVAVAEGYLLRRGEEPSEFSAPVVVKPVAAGSSHGVALATSPAEFTSALRAAWELDERVLVEGVVDGREIDIAVLRRADGSLLISDPLEIVGEGLFDTATKYDGTANFQVPAKLPDGVDADLRSAARTLYDALGCEGVARVDFFLTQDDRIVLNEVNTIPGMTEHSQVPLMFAASGWSYPDLLTELVVGAQTDR